MFSMPFQPNAASPRSPYARTNSCLLCQGSALALARMFPCAMAHLRPREPITCIFSFLIADKDHDHTGAHKDAQGETSAHKN